VTIVPLAPGHADALLDAIRDSAADLLPWLGPRYAALQTRAEVDAFIAEWTAGAAGGTQFGFVALDEARVVGFGLLNQINPFHRFGNLGYWVRTGATGRGVATALVRQLAAFGFDTVGLDRLELVIEPANAASVRVAEKAGAVREGLLRKRLAGREGPARNAYMYSLVR
jgi:ribosomal-protein-alanine N-acetyltransferase